MQLQCARLDAARPVCVFFSTVGLSTHYVGGHCRRGTLRVRKWPLQSFFYLGDMQDTVEPGVVVRGLPLSVHWPPLIGGLLWLLCVKFGPVWVGCEKISVIPNIKQDWRRFQIVTMHAWSSYRCEERPKFVIILALSVHGFFKHSETTLASCDGIAFILIGTLELVLTWRRPLCYMHEKHDQT